MRKPIRFAVIGCGRVAKNHFGPISDIDDAELTGICDLVPERAEAYHEQYGTPVFTNYHTMLSEIEADVVSIMTPSGMHPAHAMDVMQRYRKHVIIEKPMALNLNDLDRMKSVAHEARVKIFPVYQNRYNRVVQRVRADLRSGALGRPALGTVRVRWCRPQRYYDRDPWRGTWSMDGGALTNQGIHYIDLLQYIVGDVESVSADIGTQLVDVEVEDTAVARLRFKNGAIGVIEVTTAARPDDIEASVSVLAENGVAILGGIASNEFETYSLDPSAIGSCNEEFPDAYGFGHWQFYRDVIADLDNGLPHPISVNEGARAVRLLNAIYRSAEDGSEIEVNGARVEIASKYLGRPDPELAGLYEVRPPETE